jgi:lysophospholipase L1-like esterase
LVTIFFGYNDASAGMDADTFRAAQADAVARVRRAMRGRPDVLILTACPAPGSEEKLAKLAEACRQAAHQTNSGLADVQAAIAAQPPAKRAQLYARDNVHLGPAGHVLVAQTVLRAMNNGGK